MRGYLNSHIIYVAIMGTLVVAALFVVKESWLSRRSKRTQGRIQASIRGFLICSACFLGIYYGAPLSASPDFPVAKIWPLTTAVAIIVYLFTFYALWTLFMLKPEDGLLFKGSVYKLLETNAMKDMTDMEYEFTKMTMLMLTRQYQETTAVLRAQSNSIQEFLFLAVRLFLGEMESRAEPGTEIRGEVFHPEAINAITLSDVPRDFQGIVYKVTRVEPGKAVDLESGEKTGVAYALVFEGCEVVTLIWCNKSLTAVRTAQLWTCFIEFLINLPTESMENHDILQL